LRVRKPNKFLAPVGHLGVTGAEERFPAHVECRRRDVQLQALLRGQLQDFQDIGGLPEAVGGDDAVEAAAQVGDVQSLSPGHAGCWRRPWTTGPPCGAGKEVAVGEGDGVEAVEAFLDGVQGARADVPIHHSQGAQGQHQVSFQVLLSGRRLARTRGFVQTRMGLKRRQGVFRGTSAHGHFAARLGDGMYYITLSRQALQALSLRSPKGNITGYQLV